MKGVSPTKNGYWKAKYGSQYLGTYKGKEQACNIVEETINKFGPTTKSHFEDLTGKQFGNLKVVGLTGENKTRSLTYVVRNVYDGKVSVATSSRLRSGKTTGYFRWQKFPNKTFGITKRINHNKHKPDTVSYEAEIHFAGKKHYLGKFDSYEEARSKRKQAEKAILSQKFEQFINDLGGK